MKLSILNLSSFFSRRSQRLAYAAIAAALLVWVKLLTSTAKGGSSFFSMKILFNRKGHKGNAEGRKDFALLCEYLGVLCGFILWSFKGSLLY